MTVYEMVAFPIVTPVTTPDVEPTVAIEGLADVHMPPPVVLLSVAVLPVAMLVDPVILPTVGYAFTVTVLVALAEQEPVVPTTV